MRALTGRGRTRIIEILAQRCAERLRRRGLLVARVHHRRAEAHAIRILLRRVGTRKSLAEILARGK